MPIDEAYDLEDGTEVILFKDDFINKDRQIDQTLTLDTVPVFTVERGRVGGSNVWRHDVVAILFTTETPEQLAARIAAMTPAQRLVEALHNSKPPATKDSEWGKDLMLIESKRLASLVPEYKSVQYLIVCVMLGNEDFRRKVLQDDELVHFEGILTRLVLKYNGSEPTTANKRLCDALKSRPDEEIF